MQVSVYKEVILFDSYSNFTAGKKYFPVIG